MICQDTNKNLSKFSRWAIVCLTAVVLVTPGIYAEEDYDDWDAVYYDWSTDVDIIFQDEEVEAEDDHEVVDELDIWENYDENADQTHEYGQFDDIKSGSYHVH